LLIQEYFKSREKILLAAMDEYLYPKDQYPSEIHEAMRYSVFSEGKRLRPILMFAAYEMLIGRKNIGRLKRLLPAACALEFIHTASLIHDDLPSVDNSSERRGQPTCHIKFGEATAILAGDALITRAIEILADIKQPKLALECIQILTRAVSTRGMIGGQAVDIISAKKKVNITTLRYIHLKKTGALLQAAMELACAFDNAEENIRLTLGNFAINIGLSYQIVDDILDEVGSFEVLGKNPGEDARNHKATYPAFIGLEKSKKEALKLLRDSHNLIKNMPNNDVLIEFVDMIRQRLP
jgi:geranylgeranyl diphosphate synthase type II